ncbi:MAG: hypothetical protein ABI311_10905, partial [Gemmatimonadaceae bacterium]
GHAMRRQLAGDTTAVRVDTAAHPVGPWDEAGYMSSPGFEAVKGPMLVQVRALGDRTGTLALLAKAVTLLSARTNP